MKIMKHTHASCWRYSAGWLCISLAIVYLLSACQKVVDPLAEEEELHYKRAHALLREGREPAAVREFLALIRLRKIAPASHLMLGKIYLENLKDPICAIYHFRQFLDVADAKAEERRWVPQWIELAQKLFLKQYYNTSLHSRYVHDFPILLRGLRQENACLKRRVLELEQQWKNKTSGKPRADSHPLEPSLRR